MKSAELNELIRTREACFTVMGWLKARKYLAYEQTSVADILTEVNTRIEQAQQDNLVIRGE